MIALVMSTVEKELRCYETRYPYLQNVVKIKNSKKVKKLSHDTAWETMYDFTDILICGPTFLRTRAEA